MARKGQPTFRKKTIRAHKQCEATLSKCIFAADACHIKPYSLCNDSEKLDPNNSILFLSSIHRAFDHGYISFDNDGKIIVSIELSSWELQCLGLTGNEQIRMPGKRPEYIQFHRENIFRDNIHD